MAQFQWNPVDSNLQQKANSFYVAFGGHSCRMDFQSVEIEKLLAFLFSNMLVDSPNFDSLTAHYKIECDEHNQWLLYCGNKFVGTYGEINALGNFLSGDVLFRLIEPNINHLAIHAGLVSQETGSLLLPAESGSGKTSVTAWLVNQGWNYHTDELVLIDLHGQDNLAFSRPLNIKPHGLAPIVQLLGLDEAALELLPVRQAEGITMMHQSMFTPATNSRFKATIPAIRSIIFPNYVAKAKPTLDPLAPAAAGLEMMRSNVIARNLQGHGFTDIVDMVRATPAYQLSYSHFDDLEALFSQVADTW